MNLILIVLALIAMASIIRLAFRDRLQAEVRPKRVTVGNANRKFFRAHWRKLYLAPLLFERLTWWLGFSRQPRGGVQFCNIGEGVHEHGKKSYIPDAATTSRYLLYKIGSDGDHCAICGAGDIPLGSSDDLAESTALDVPITIKLFGATVGTTRIITDGTLLNGSKVTTCANGYGTLAVSTNIVIGVAIIGTDTSANAGDSIEIIPNLPLKAPF